MNSSGMPSRLPVVIAVLLLAAVVLAYAVPSTPSRAAQNSKVRCGPGPKLPSSWLERGGIVLFGDFHGTEELPAAFGEAVCQVAATGREVLVALEMPRDEQSVVQSYLDTSRPDGALAKVLASPFWSRDFQDGRTSRAMAALLGRLRDLRLADLPVELLFFDLGKGDTASDRDAGMAEHLIAEARAHPEAVTLAFVGNFHARTAPGAPWDPNARPMGWFIRQAGARVKAIDGSGPEGTAWTCGGVGPTPCGAQPVISRGRPGEGPALEVFQAEADGGFAGRYVVPSLTASPPAVWKAGPGQAAASP